MQASVRGPLPVSGSAQAKDRLTTLVTGRKIERIQ